MNALWIKTFLLIGIIVNIAYSFNLLTKTSRIITNQISKSIISNNHGYNHRTMKSGFQLHMAKGKNDNGKSNKKNNASDKKSENTERSISSSTDATIMKNVIPKVKLDVTISEEKDEDGRSLSKISSFNKYYSSSVPAGKEMDFNTFKAYPIVKNLLDDDLVTGKL